MAKDPHDDRPILSGIIALVATTLVIGLVLGGGVLFFTQTGGGGSDVEGEASSQQTLVIPEADGDDDDEDGGGLDLPGGPGRPSTTLDPVEPDASPSEAPGGITLRAAQDSVAPGQQIDLTGTYPGGDGSTLQIEVFRDGAWSDFPVTVPVTGRDFATFITTSQTGPTRFRLTDPADGTMSNEVDVQVG